MGFSKTRSEAFAKLRARFPIKRYWDYQLDDLIDALVALDMLKLRQRKPRKRRKAAP